MADKIKELFLRIFISGTAGILVLMFISAIIPDNSSDRNYYADIAIAFIMSTEGLLILDKLLNKRVAWFPNFRKRLILQLSLSTLWLFTISFIMLLISYEKVIARSVNTRSFILSIVFGIIFQYMVNSILVTRTFLEDRQNRELEKEKLKREKLKADYNLLQNQLNPHFLFNSLNVLLSEIRLSKDAAISYCESLADVYRYVLQSKDQNTVSLRTEKEAFEKHLYLQQVRFGNNMIIESNVEDYMLDYEIPPMTVQILVENALKHNIISESKPLYIWIKIDNRELTIKNNLQLRKDVVSTGIGLQNIKQRYYLLTDREVKIEKTQDYFSVTIPLLGD